MVKEIINPIYEIWGFELFDKIWSSTNFNKEQTNLIVDSLKSTDKLLDLGIGVGNVAKKFLETGKDVCGIDITLKSLNYVKKKIGILGKKLVLLRMDAQKLNFKEEFDGAYCASNLAYFSDLNAVMVGVHSALKLKGLFAITGYEKEKMDKWVTLTGKESLQAIQEGKVTLTKKELKMLSISQNVDLTQQIDSSERTIETLLKNGFIILSKCEFYYNTCYFILAQKSE